MNGQIVYPVFLITSVIKDANKVKVECIQMHKLSRDFEANLGDITRDGVSGTEDDRDLLIAYVDETIPRDNFTNEQIKNMDVNNSKGISYRDINYWDDEFGG